MALDIPDALFGSDEDTVEEAVMEEAPEEVVGSPDAEEEDTQETGPDPDEEDTDTDPEESDLDGQGEEEEEEEESPEDGEGEADEDTDETESFLPEFDRKKFLEEHPELEPAYKHFQAAFTKAQQAVKAKEREVVALQEDYEAFATQLQDEQGCQDFLVQLAMRRPEVFEAAYEKVLTLNEDEGEKKSYLLEEENKKLKAEKEKAKKLTEQQKIEQRLDEIVNLAESAASKHKLSAKAVKIVHRDVAAQIRANRDRTGKGDITPEEINQIVQDVADAVEAAREEARKEARREVDQKSKAKLKAKAKESPRPVARSVSAKGGKIAPKKDEKPASIGSRVDELLGM